MRIEHIGVWTRNVEGLVRFYVTYFGAVAGEKYVNPKKGFESRFLAFADGARIEVMRTTALSPMVHERGVEGMGYTHLAFSTGSEKVVDVLTARLRGDGFEILDGPRHTGDGYYESVVLDPDGNRVEITV